MTVAVDIRTGRILGQYLDNQPGIRWEDGRIADPRPQVLLLDAKGYLTVPRASVRLEEV